MTLLDPLWTQNLAYSGTEDRALMAAVLRGGVVGAVDLKVVQRAAGTNMSVDVAAGAVAVPGTDAAGQGTYLCISTAVENVTIGGAPSAGNTRLDLVVAKVRDGDVDLGPNNDWIITVVAGTPASSPVEPAIPVSSVVLARVSIASGVAAVTNAMITNRRTFANHVSPATSTTLPLGRTGQLAVLTDTDALVRGQTDGTWRDVLSSGLNMAATSGSIFGGTPPSTAGTKWKVECFTQAVGAISGLGDIVCPSAFAGILAFTAMPHIDSTPVTVGFRPSGLVSATNIAVKIWEHGTPGWLTGSVFCSCVVVGW